MKTESNPSSSARTLYSRSVQGSNCSAEALYPNLIPVLSLQAKDLRSAIERGPQVLAHQRGDGCPVACGNQLHHLLVLTVRVVREGAVDLGGEADVRFRHCSQRADVREQALPPAVFVEGEVKLLVLVCPLAARPRC